MFYIPLVPKIFYQSSMTQLPVSSCQLAAVFKSDSTNLVIVGQEVNYEYRYWAMNTLRSVLSNSPPVGKGSQGGILGRMDY